MENERQYIYRNDKGETRLGFFSVSLTDGIVYSGFVGLHRDAGYKRWKTLKSLDSAMGKRGFTRVGERGHKNVTSG